METDRPLRLVVSAPDALERHHLPSLPELAVRLVQGQQGVGLRSPWKIDEAPNFASGEPNPCPCEVTPGRSHYLHGLLMATAAPPAAKRHKHTFSLFSWHFGPFGRQDVHVHDCQDDDCARVLVGAGRDCDGKPESHHRETLGG